MILKKDQMTLFGKRTKRWNIFFDIMIVIIDLRLWKIIENI
jgi:hypothetical protein